MIRKTNVAHSTNARTVQLGSSCVIALGLLLGGFGMTSPSVAAPLIAGTDFAKEFDQIGTGSDLYLEVDRFRDFSRNRTRRAARFYDRRSKRNEKLDYKDDKKTDKSNDSR